MERTARDSRQEEFLSEVQSWAGGHMTEEFGDPEGLRVAVTRQLHRTWNASNWWWTGVQPKIPVQPIG